MTRFPPVRSALFVPGDRADRIEKAARAGADAVIIDLEDAVAPAAKPEARDTVHATAATWDAPPPLIVRINALACGTAGKDLAACVHAPLCGVMAPKVDGAGDVRQLDRLLGETERLQTLPQGRIALIALLESARGVQQAAAVADSLAALARPAAVAFGAADFCADMGIALIPDGEALAFARARLALACRTAGIDALLDSPFMTDLKNTALLREDALRARQLGFQGKLCVHPIQVPVVNAVFSPAPEEVAQARRVVAAFEAAGDGVFELDGKMIDAPIVAQARRVLERATNHG